MSGKRVMAVGVFDLLHAGHLHYLEQAKALGEHLTVVVAHDDTVRLEHDPVTPMAFRQRLVAGLKPVDEAIVGNALTFPSSTSCPRFVPTSSRSATTKNTRSARSVSASTNSATTPST